MRRIFTTLALLGLVLSASCAMSERENRRALEVLNENLVPESPGGKWALAPVALPAGLVALAVDATVIHPGTTIDDAWGDTVEILWEYRDESQFRRALLAPLAGLATPFVFVGHWLWRSAISVPPREVEAEIEGGDRR